MYPYLPTHFYYLSKATSASCTTVLRNWIQKSRWKKHQQQQFTQGYIIPQFSNMLSAVKGHGLLCICKCKELSKENGITCWSHWAKMLCKCKMGRNCHRAENSLRNLPYWVTLNVSDLIPDWECKVEWGEEVSPRFSQERAFPLKVLHLDPRKVKHLWQIPLTAAVQVSHSNSSLLC